MKILFSSHAFYPNLGGLETVSRLLATDFARAGEDVVLITQSLGDGTDHEFPFKIIRRPSVKELIQLITWADVAFHSNISLRSAWPLLWIRKPWVVAHHIWLPRGRNLASMKGALKRVVLRSATGIAISQAIARDFTTPCAVIPDPYDDEIFKILPNIEQDKDLVFVGRFVSDKGLPVLLHALANLRNQGIAPSLTVIGGGPEEVAWQRLTQDIGLAEQVQFVGSKRGRELASELNRHRVLVVPSLWNEPFGVVALEGMACGCIVVGSEGGGLTEAIGQAGLTFPNGDADGLAKCLAMALTDEDVLARCLSAAPAHLTQHRPANVAMRYLETFARAMYGGPKCLR